MGSREKLEGGPGSIRTSRQGEGRVPEIERRNRELGGFLTVFARLPEGEQAKVLQSVEQLKAEVGEEDPDLFMDRVQALAELYGAVAESIDPRLKGGEAQEAFRVKLGEIAGAAEELLRVRSEKSGK